MSVEIQKPRAVHNWRDLLSEIGIIVIGVVIALTAQEVVQGFELRATVRHTEDLMRGELALDDGPQVLQRIALAPCIDQSLGRIRSSIEHGAPRPVLIAEINGYEPPRHSWDSVVFQWATASGIVAHLPPERLWRWAYVYSIMPLLDRANEREFLHIAGLRSVSASGGQLTEAERIQLLGAVESLRQDNADITAHVVPVEAAIKELGIRIGSQGKQIGNLFAAGGPLRVVDQLRGQSMAAPCLPALERAMSGSP
jgi:hypothetical protein